MLDELLAPMPKNYCELFSIYSIVALIGLVVFIIFHIYVGLTKKKPAIYYLGSLIALIPFILTYLQYRLFYNMCKSSGGTTSG